MKTLEEIREYFSHDAYAVQTTGAEIIEARPGYGKVRLVLDERHINGAGHVMGGVYFTLADLASAVAINHDFDEELSVGMTGNIEFISSVTGGTIYAEAMVLKEGRKVSFSEIRVTDENGKLLAQTNMSSYKVKTR
ncbi:MAG: PaaI family thioesterase [Lachnospiraceae bacterium]|nr:PaaI family thioesterase [Lachnospiraceae bacterium]